MNAATAAEWWTAAAIGIALYLPIVAAAMNAGQDLPHPTARDVAERARILLALTRHLEKEASR